MKPPVQTETKIKNTTFNHAEYNRWDAKIREKIDSAKPRPIRAGKL